MIALRCKKCLDTYTFMKTGPVWALSMGSGAAAGLLLWLIAIYLVPNAMYRIDSSGRASWRIVGTLTEFLAVPFRPQNWPAFWIPPHCRENIIVMVGAGLVIGMVAAAVWSLVHRDKKQKQ